MHVLVSLWLRSQRRAFTMLEVMVAVLILAIGISAALNAIINNTNLRNSLDENTLADLVLRQMTAKIKSTSAGTFGQTGWAQHRRATDSSIVSPTLTAATINGTLKPLTQGDLITEGILRDKIQLEEMSVYIEYYNLMTITGQVSTPTGGLTNLENGLFKLFANLQDANQNEKPLNLWYKIVGDPDTSRHPGNVTAPPTELKAQELIMPGIFSVANVNDLNTPEQVRGAFNHGLVIRVLVSWRPREISDPLSSYRKWRETIIVRRN